MKNIHKDIELLRPLYVTENPIKGVLGLYNDNNNNDGNPQENQRI